MIRISFLTSSHKRQGTLTQADSSYDVRCTVLDSDTKNSGRRKILTQHRVRRGLRDTRQNDATEVIESKQRAGDVVQYVLSTCKALGLKTSRAKQQSVGTCETTTLERASQAENQTLAWTRSGSAGAMVDPVCMGARDDP